MHIMLRTGIFLMLSFTACKTRQKEIRPEVRELTEAVYASGILVPEEEYKLVSRMEGYVTEVATKEGDTVSKGQLLFRISNSSREAQEASAEALVKRTIPVTGSQAPAIRELEGRIELVKIRLSNDSIQFRRYRNLFEQNAISQSTLEKYQLQYESTEKELSNLQQQLDNIRLNNNLQLQQAENQLAISKTEVANGLLRSFTSGIVYEIYKKQGDLVNVNQPVALIGRGRMIARLFADEDDLERVREGQQVLITMDAFPGKLIHARIKRLYPMLNRVEQSFRVDAVFEDSLPAPIYGLNIEANIVISEKRKTLVVPKAALQHGDSLLIRSGGVQKLVKIERGTEDRDWVEVKGDIDAETIIIIKS